MFLGASRNFSASIGSFQGLPAEALEVILLPQRLALKYNTTPPALCQHFLTTFFQFLCDFFLRGKTQTETDPLRHRCANKALSKSLAYRLRVRYYIL